jgi:hypothetical protein
VGKGQGHKTSKSDESIENVELEEIVPAEPENDPEKSTASLKKLRDDAPDPSERVDTPAMVDDGFQAPPDAGLSALEDLLKASEGTNAIDIALDPAGAIFGHKGVPVDSPEHMSEFGLHIPTPEEVAAIENGDRLPTVAEAIKRDGWSPADRDLADQVGSQPNGDYGVVVTVPEQLVSLVLGQAQMDGVTPGEWLTVRLGEYLEQWTFGR